MAKIKSLDELKKIREQATQNTGLRTTGENPDRIILAVGMATCGIAAGARETLAALVDKVTEHKLENVSVITTGCLGYCYAEPLVEVREPGKDPIRYGNVDAARAIEIIEKHIVGGALLDNAILSQEVNRLE